MLQTGVCRIAFALVLLLVDIKTQLSGSQYKKLEHNYVKSWCLANKMSFKSSAVAL